MFKFIFSNTCVCVSEERKKELKEAARDKLHKPASNAKKSNAESSPVYSIDELLDKVLLLRVSVTVAVLVLFKFILLICTF